MNISKQQAAEMIRGSGGQWLTVDVVKRTTGELRTLNCRIGVSKYVTGRGMAYNPAERGLITVFDAAKGQYRMIATEGITRLAISGQQYDVMPEHTAAA
jgi:hypothetical protein